MKKVELSHETPAEVLTHRPPLPGKPPEARLPDPKAGGLSWRRKWVVGGVLLAMAAAAYLTFGRDGGGPDEKKGRGDRAVPVAAAAAVKGDIEVFLNGLGTVTPLNVATVRPRVDGQLEHIHFREGDTVAEGELLAEIDARALQVQLAQAQGQLAKDKAALDNAKRDLERYRKLLAQDAAPSQQVDNQKSLVRQLEGTLKSTQAQIEAAELQLSHSKITAPIGGRLGLRQVDEGNMVSANDPNGIVVITQMRPITVVFPIPEDSLPAVMRRLNAGEKLPVEAYDRGGKTLLASGTLLTADNQIDPTTGTIKLKAEFGNEEGLLFPSQFVNVRLRVDTQRDATIIPTAAVQRGTLGTFVYLVDGEGTASVQPVTLGPAEGEKVAVEQGLTAGQMVVVDGADKLRDGSKVSLGSEATAEAAEPGGGGRGKAGGKGGDQPGT